MLIPMTPLPPLNTLRTFEAAARRLSFKKAAEELSVTPTAVSHQIRTLEAFLGARLFERRTREVRLTPAGETLFRPLSDSFRDIARAVASARAPAIRKSITLSGTVAFTARRLAPAAGSFRLLNPEWTLRLHASNDPVDLEGDEADAAIRYGSGSYGALAAEPLLSDCFAPVCNPALEIRTVDDLKKAPLIHFDWGPAMRDATPPGWRRWAELAGLKPSDVQPGLSFTDEIHAIQATVAGQGVGLLSLALVAEELAAGTLIQPFGPVLGGYTYSLVYPHHAAGSPGIDALRSWIQTWLSARHDQ
jgi:LysR family transcriptional regulator, glycine cleavage system transcriptional activator